jgi:hypothetical protein|tara:strand:+ start:305 stop:886 length:582 start_codon:yes stop_codon:yes gene_type:complete
MKLIMESWREYLAEDIEKPQTWGELAQNITLATAAEKWPRMGRSLLKFGIKIATSKVKDTLDAIESIEATLDWIPDEIQEKLETGSEQATQWLADKAKEKGGAIGSFLVDDVMGMDDSLTKDLPGFAQLNLEDEYESLIDKEKLKKWAKSIIKMAKQANPDTPLPDLNAKLEQDMQDATGAHPDVDEPDIRDD